MWHQDRWDVMTVAMSQQIWCHDRQGIMTEMKSWQIWCEESNLLLIPTKIWQPMMPVDSPQLPFHITVPNCVLSNTPWVWFNILASHCNKLQSLQHIQRSLQHKTITSLQLGSSSLRLDINKTSDLSRLKLGWCEAKCVDLGTMTHSNAVIHYHGCDPI